MRTKIPIIFLALFLSVPAFAQQPRIDSIAVDEDKGELVLHGSFQNSSSAIVLVDSVSLPVTLASDTLIRATIPVSGKGSAGWVSVSTGIQSNKKLLTYFHFYSYYFYAIWDISTDETQDTFNVRFDAQSFNMIAAYKLSKISRYHHLFVNLTGGGSYDSSRILKGEIQYDAKNKTFSYDMGTTPTDLYISANLDNSYEIISVGSGPGCTNQYPGINECQGWNSIASTNFPPSTANVRETSSNPNILQTHLSSDPVTANAEMIVTLHDAMNVRMEIMDILGHIVFSDERMMQAGMNKLPINSSALPPGIYICRLQAGGEVVSVRFVKE